jgi:tetratricopeptide (TPR) repeat protein
LCLFFVSGSGCGIRVWSVRGYEREFEAVEKAFDAAAERPASEQASEFRLVANMYQGLIDKGIRSGQLYYNQGNAWFYAGERGRAIAAYRIALRYLPNDARILANLRTASGITNETKINSDPNNTSSIQMESGDGILAAERVPFFEYLFFWQNRLGVYEKVLCSQIFAIVLFVSGLLVLFLRQRFRRVFLRFSVVVFVLTLISVVSVAYDWYRFECFSYVVVSVETAEPRKGNSLQYDKAFIKPVPFGSTAIIIGERGDWLHLRFGESQDGWLQKTQVVRY